MPAIHIITPFSRNHLIDFLVEHLRQFNIIWHPICHENVPFPNESWIVPMFVDISNLEPNQDICYSKLNQFLNCYDMLDDDYFMFMCDDDAYENKSLFEMIRRRNDDVIFVSMKRGNLQPYIQLLIAHPSMIQVDFCGLEQIIVKGKILRQHRFVQFASYADGLLNVEIFKAHGAVFEPDEFVLFNVNKPGWWS